MKVSVDIGGVLSAYPHKMLALLHPLHHDGHQIHVITDMPETMRDEVLTQLRENGFEWIDPENVHHADYETHGHLAKAIILHRLQISIHIDDFPGYLVWDSALGRAPLRLLVTPDAFRPFIHPDWKCESASFGHAHANIREIETEIKS